MIRMQMDSTYRTCVQSRNCQCLHACQGEKTQRDSVSELHDEKYYGLVLKCGLNAVRQL
jgi:hypothetical protein